MTLPTKLMTTPAQDQAMIEARVAFMAACPFFAYFYYDQLSEYPTTHFTTAATDGKRLFYNPPWFLDLKVLERCFVLAHETYHAVWRHSPRALYYRRTGNVDGVPYFHELFNTAADYVINADLINLKIGICNPEWLYRPDVKGTDKIEEVYKKLYEELPPPPPGRSKKPGDGVGGADGVTTGSNEGGGRFPTQSYGRGSVPDKRAKAAGGRFDEVQEPYVDPVTGEEDVTDEITFREAVARAVQAAKAIGSIPGSIQRLVDEILEPQVDWKDKFRLSVTGKVGNRREDWSKVNRRRLVLNPIIYLPGKRGYGADFIAVWIDSSGSVGEREYNAFFSEGGGIMQDVKPRRMLVGWCDAIVQGTEWVYSLDEVEGLYRTPIPGRGGTSFIPPFEWMAENGLVPDCMVYLTDGFGAFPKKPEYPVIWCMSTDKKAPFGDVIQIKP